MDRLILFFRTNSIVLVGMIVGVIMGFLHWSYFGCYWGTYPLSAECWVNCCYGAIFGGFIFSLLDKDYR